MKHIKRFNESFDETPPKKFKSKEEFIEYWTNVLKGTSLEELPKNLLDRFETYKSYQEFEKENYLPEDWDIDEEFDYLMDELDMSKNLYLPGIFSMDTFYNFINSCWTW